MYVEGHRSAVHGVQSHYALQQHTNRRKLFGTENANEAIAFLKNILKKLKVPNADRAGWKCIRGGKATALAHAGTSVPEILELGGWKSVSSAKHYIKEDVEDVDKMADELQEALLESDEDV